MIKHQQLRNMRNIKQVPIIIFELPTLKYMCTYKYCYCLTRFEMIFSCLRDSKCTVYEKFSIDNIWTYCMQIMLM